MGKMGRAVVSLGQQFEIREFSVPTPAANTLLLRQELAGICGTDLHNWQKGIPTETLMGHENVGVIEQIGTGLTTDYVGNPIEEGDRIVFHPRNGASGYGFGNPDVYPFTGGFADYIYLYGPTTCFLKMDAVPEVAVLAEPLATAVHSVMRGNVQLGDTVIVQGSGAIGLLTLVCAKLSGATRLIMVGGPAGRLELAKKLGAHVTVNIEDVPDVEERSALVKSYTQGGAGANVVFECAGFLPAFTEGLDYVKEDGTFVEVGHFVDIGTTVVNPHLHFLRKNLRFEGIYGSRYHHFVPAVAILENNEFPFADLVSHQLPLESIMDGFNALNGSYHLGDEAVVKIALKSAA
ncbi:MAG: zinc-binding dehydrogenase [Chloroflexota bacterium]